jgi:hypothetical protein
VKSFALLFSLLLLCGCETTGWHREPHYYKVVTMDLNGSLISSWIAKGHIWRRERGYSFKAVERQIEHSPTVYRYPLGWRVKIAAPKTIIYRVEKPAWLNNIKPLDVADAAEDGVQATPPMRLEPLRKPAADRAR